jgi:microcin C transport system ATP-binding protein
MRPLRREMQVVFQDPYGSLSPCMSVGQITEEGLKIHGIGSPAERDAMIARSLEEGGQRIAIARAMVLKPRFVRPGVPPARPPAAP